MNKIAFGMIGAIFRDAFSSVNSYEPPGYNAASRRLDAIARAQAEALHVERMRKSCADMADLIEHARQGEFRESE